MNCAFAEKVRQSTLIAFDKYICHKATIMVAQEARAIYSSSIDITFISNDLGVLSILSNDPRH
jgi:hypothetical protein